jgi:hypothetical protein
LVLSCEKRNANAIGTADCWSSADGQVQTASAGIVILRKAAADIDFDQAAKLAGRIVNAAQANGAAVRAVQRHADKSSVKLGTNCHKY